MTHHTL